MSAEKGTTLLDLLKGRKMSVMTDMMVEVELTIKEVKSNHHSRDLEESNASNDWWPAQETWTTYTVFFTNGSQKNFSSLEQIKVMDEKPKIEFETERGTGYYKD